MNVASVEDAEIFEPCLIAEAEGVIAGEAAEDGVEEEGRDVDCIEAVMLENTA